MKNQRSKRHQRRPAIMRWLKAQFFRNPPPVWVVVVADVLVFAVALNVFALFHHVLPRSEKSYGVKSQRISTAQLTGENTASEGNAVPGDRAEAVEETDAPLPDVTPEPDPVGVFARRFADKFTNGEVIATAESYQSKNVNVQFTKHTEPELVYYVADIYIRKIECFRTAFAKDKFGRGRWERVSSMSERMNGVIAINGDYYGGRSDGIVIRNGEYYRNEKNPIRDICIINWDGTMETYGPEAWDPQRAVARGAYQGWNFGPMLLDEEGNAMTEFNSEVGGRNPRTAIGYYEPGHYCFVVVDGRSKQSKGIGLVGLSEIMHNLGCKRAYNFDGGQSSEMVIGNKIVSNPYKGGRKNSDAVLIIDE